METTKSMTIDEAVAQYNTEQEALVKAEWTVGFNDRGLGHGDFGVITTKGDFVVGPCSHALAGHIVEVHNNARNAARKKQSKASSGRKTRSKHEKG